MEIERETEEQAVNKYRHLPRAPSVPRTCAPRRTSCRREPVGEADREREWLLRTAGIFI